MSQYTVNLNATGCYANTGDEGGQPEESRLVEGSLADAVDEIGIRSGTIYDSDDNLVAQVRWRGDRRLVVDASGDLMYEFVEPR